MLINFEKEFIYIRPTKVGSTSFMHFLTNNDHASDFINYQGFRSNGKIAYYKDNTRLDPYGYAHATAKKIKQAVSEELFNSYAKVTSVRNPYTQVLSSFLFHRVRLKRLLSYKHLGDFAKHAISKPKKVLKLFVLSSQLKSLWYEYIKSVTPYSSWIELDGKLICDDYIRIEYFDDDLKIFCSKYGYEFKNIERLNVNKKNTDEVYDRFLDKKSIEIIKSKHRNIFDKFDYQPPKE